MFVCDLRAQTIHVIVAATDAYQFRAKHLCAQNLRGLEIGGNKNPRLQTFARSLCRHRIREIPRRGAGDGIEPESARISERDRHHTIFEAQCGQAHRVIFNEEPARSDLLAKSRRANQRGEPNWEGGLVPRG